MGDWSAFSHTHPNIKKAGRAAVANRSDGTGTGEKNRHRRTLPIDRAGLMGDPWVSDYG